MGTCVFLNEEEILSIEPLGIRKTIDITLDGNNLFFANDMLTHNSGFSNSDVGMDDTAESFALPALADLFLAITQTDELKESNKYLVKQLKNRMGDMAVNTRFVIGVDKPKMRLYSIDDQNGIIQESSIQTNSQPFSKPKLNRDKFNGFS
jgi:hypothetical protein